MIEIIQNPRIQSWSELAERPAQLQADLSALVKDVFDRIASNGDSALLSYTRKFDGVDLAAITLSLSDVGEQGATLNEELKDAIRAAAKNIETFHAAQRMETRKIETQSGVTCWRVQRPVERVGLYIPGGSAPLFSTVLMLGIPAVLAGCKEIVLCTPPMKDGTIHPAIAFAATLVGVTKVCLVGGVQAIAGMAVGTESIPAVKKIFGPGNQYVTAAKQYAQQMGVAIDMPAGPSEVLVIADDQCEPAFVAADLLSQAEHGPDSQVVLLSTSLEVLNAVRDEVFVQLEALPRKKVTAEALKYARFIQLESLEACIAFSNRYAPEHLILAIDNAEDWVALVESAGSIFLGNYSCESAGDYASGTNHTLPTNGYAANYSGVSFDSFVKNITVQSLTAEGIQNIGRTIERMADAEGLQAHKNAVSLRLKMVEA